MTFLTSQPNLSKTVFKENDLEIARKVLQSLILQYDPSWLNKPQGMLANYWRRNDTQAACYLIDLAKMIVILDHRIATKSIPLLYEKVKKLLRPPYNRHSNTQFLETLNELQIAYALVGSIAENIALAFLTEDDFVEPKMSRTPDFGFISSEGLVLIDATVFHGGILDTWTQTVNKINEKLRHYIQKHNLMLSVSIKLPLIIDKSPDEIFDLSINAFRTSPGGRLPVGNKGSIEWEPFPIIILDNPSMLQEIPFSIGAFITPGTIADKAYGSQMSINFLSEEDILQARELVLKGLRSKLKEKKTQFPPKGEPEPCFIAMRLEHNQIGEGDIAAMLNERIWPNDDYNWLTGLTLFIPRFKYDPENFISKLIWYFNPRSIRPATPSLKNILCKPS